MNPCVTIDPETRSTIINASALDELKENNCTMPDIDRVIYNLKTWEWKTDENGQKVKADLENPVLATVVYFIDETKVTVKNSLHDKVDVIETKLSDGNVVKTADRESKERGLIYAVLKRMVSKPDENGVLIDSGLSRILREMVDNAYDTQVEEAEAKIKKAAQQAKHKELTSKPKKVRYSIHDTLERINKLLDKAEAGDVAAKNVVENVASELKA